MDILVDIRSYNIMRSIEKYEHRFTEKLPPQHAKLGWVGGGRDTAPPLYYSIRPIIYPCCQLQHGFGDGSNVPWCTQSVHSKNL